MNLREFCEDSTQALLADIDAMTDFLGMIRTADMDPVRGELAERLSAAREGLLQIETARRRKAWFGAGLLVVGAVLMTYWARTRER